LVLYNIRRLVRIDPLLHRHTELVLSRDECLFDRIEAKVAAREGKETSCALQKKVLSYWNKKGRARVRTGVTRRLIEVKIWSDNHYLYWRLDRLHVRTSWVNVHYTTMLFCLMPFDSLVTHILPFVCVHADRSRFFSSVVSTSGATGWRVGPLRFTKRGLGRHTSIRSPAIAHALDLNTVKAHFCPAHNPLRTSTTPHAAM
jgi:hypothetical protein